MWVSCLKTGYSKKLPFQRADVGPGAREMVCAAHQGWCHAQIPMSFPKFPDVIQNRAVKSTGIVVFFRLDCLKCWESPIFPGKIPWNFLQISRKNILKTNPLFLKIKSVKCPFSSSQSLRSSGVRAWNGMGNTGKLEFGSFNGHFG